MYLNTAFYTTHVLLFASLPSNVNTSLKNKRFVLKYISSIKVDVYVLRKPLRTYSQNVIAIG